MSESTSGKLTLPEFEVDKTYLLKGETLQKICDVIKENKIVLTGTKQFDEIGPQGSKLNLSDPATGAGSGCGDTDPPGSGTVVCGAIDGVMQWIDTTPCDCTTGTIDGGSA